MNQHAHGATDHSGHAGHDTSEADMAAHKHSDHGRSASPDHESGEHAHHPDHTGHELMFRRRFWVSLVLSIPVLIFSPTIQDWLNFSAPVFMGSDWIPLVFSVIVFAYGGVPFLQMALPEIRNRAPGMMTLISMAISVAFVYSVADFAFDLGEGFFWELVTLIDVMLLGHWLEMRSVRQASGALNELASLMPDTAERVLSDGTVEVISVDELMLGDIVLVRPGASVPADGEIMEGESEVNEAMITGESRPVAKAPSDELIAGTVNGEGSLRVRVGATGDETTLAGIMRLVEEAQSSKSRTQILADKAAGWLFYAAIAIAAITGIAWLIADGFGVEVLSRVVTVLVIACPHALGLAIPLVVAISTAMSARNGVLIRDRLALEEARNIDTVVFDKTGTLTEGVLGVNEVRAFGDIESEDALALVAAIEGDSEHVIAAAIRREAEQRRLELPTVSRFSAIRGRGVEAEVDGQVYDVGGPRMLEILDVQLSEDVVQFSEVAGNSGQTVVYLITNRTVQAGISLSDIIRPESLEAVRQLQSMGVEVAMLTGDSEAVAASVAEQLGIETYFAEVLPEHKDQKVAELQAQGKRVAMVGDGINDSPALARADIGIAIGSGTNVAIESAEIVLVRSNPLDIVSIVTLSRASYRKMVQNLAWATGYNVVALPLAAGVAAPLGFLPSPALGAVFMSLSTIIVAINAQLLRRTRL
jgi:Cu2+-exporting ATPase